jgi:hypothetical protein
MHHTLLSLLILVACDERGGFGAGIGSTAGAPGDEVCDGVDNDHDGETDEADALDARAWFEDADGDGWGRGAGAEVGCRGPQGWVDVAGDCDDGDPTVHAMAEERCDGVDSDCDGVVDDNPSDGFWVYQDADADGWGDEARAELACGLFTGWSTEPGDCDDRDGEVHPDAEEICGDGVDNDCDGSDEDCP